MRRARPLSESSPRLLLWLGVLSSAVGMTALAVLRHRAFNTGRFDLGNMVQAVWSTADGRPLRVTDLGGEQVSRLSAHFDPLLAGLAPLWWLWPSPEALLTAQAVALALGALPVFWLGRKHLGSDRPALAFALAYLLLPPVQWLALDDFHAVALACPLLLFSLWYLDEERLLPFAAFALAATAAREEVPLAIAGIGVWYALSRGRRRAGVAIAGVAAGMAFVVVGLVLPHFSGGPSNFYGRYSAVGGSPRGILETALTDPVRLLEVAFDRRGLAYLLALVLPLAALPLLAPLALVPALPQLAINLLSDTPTQTSIHFHYTAVLIAPLTAAAVFGAARLQQRGASSEAIAALVLAATLVASYRLGPLPLWRSLPGAETLGARAHEVTPHDRITERALRLVPEDAVVSASNSLGAHLSARRRVLSFPLRRDATWIAVDETRPSHLDRADAPEAMAAAVARLRRDREWRLVFGRDGVLLFRRRATTEESPAGAGRR